MSRLFRALLAGLLFGAAGCYADGYAVYDPPAGYVATAQPYYYGGRPSYWYRNRWHYRTGGGWGHYRSEPVVLRGYRARPGFARGGVHVYERGRR